MEQEKLIELVKQAQASDSAAIELLITYAHTPVSYQCRKFMDTAADAEDLTQEVFYLDQGTEDIILVPGSYCYLTARFSGDSIDRQAQDIHDVVTVTIPVGVQVGEGDRTDYSLRITRDQFVG